MSTRRMSHLHDPDTSYKAAMRAVRGTKKGAIQGQILAFLSTNGDGLTAKEMHGLYQIAYQLDVIVGLPPADLYDVRRRLTELKRDHGSVEDSGVRRNGEAVMRLTRKEKG